MQPQSDPDASSPDPDELDRQRWEDDGGRPAPDARSYRRRVVILPRLPQYSPAIRPLSPTEQTILRQLAEEFFDSLAV